MATQSSIIGALKVIGNPEGECATYQSFSELLAAIAQSLGVEIPNQSFSNVIISNVQPGSVDRDKIWWRMSNSGTFVGVYVFSNSTWVQVLPAPQQVFWLYGDSANPPDGFSFDAVATVFSAPVYTALITNNALPAGAGPYEYYPALYVGL